MIITNSASQLILDLLKKENKTGVRFFIKRSCCGASLDADFIDIEGNECININQIPVLMDDDTQYYTQNIIVDRDGDYLVVRQNGGCGCNSGCSCE